MSMLAVNLRQYRPDDVEYIANNMRRSDSIEVDLSHGHTPREALIIGVNGSHFITTVEINHTPCAMFGLTMMNALSGTGVPWLLSSTDSEKYKREFLRLGPPMVKQMLSICPNLVNYVHSENKMVIRWLRWLGFTMCDPAPYGVKGALFHRFYIGEIHNV